MALSVGEMNSSHVGISVIAAPQIVACVAVEMIEKY
jgi:hypothetical protein